MLNLAWAKMWHEEAKYSLLPLCPEVTCWESCKTIIKKYILKVNITKKYIIQHKYNIWLQKKKKNARFCALTHIDQLQMGNSSADSFNWFYTNTIRAGTKITWRRDVCACRCHHYRWIYRVSVLLACHPSQLMRFRPCHIKRQIVDTTAERKEHHGIYWELEWKVQKNGF